MVQLFIKNMVCNRCIMVVEKELEQLGLNFEDVKLGEIHLKKPLEKAQRETLEESLVSLGFEIIDDKKSQTIEKIKSVIIDLVHRQDNESKLNLSEFLSQELNQDYSTLSHLFSEVESTTIEKYFIAQRIEKVKELLVYDEMTLSEIAFQLRYSSVAYLSNQFKKVTGLSPSHFKKISADKRRPLDAI